MRPVLVQIMSIYDIALLHQEADLTLHKRRQFPSHGQKWDDLQSRMREVTRADTDWRRGRTPLFVFFNDQETYEVGRNAFFNFFTENALGGGRAFFGIGQMEKEVIDCGLDLFHAPSDAGGAFTNGGTESIFLAVKAARDFHRARHGLQPGRQLNIVMPDTAHAAFDKSADVMDLELRRAPLDASRRADVEAMRRLIDDNTMLLVGSAPCYPHGVTDPVEAISDLAIETGIWLHVDACVGGWILPFFKRNGRDVPDFDFRFPGVRSISADLHKFGFCPKPASTVFYRDQTDIERAMFVADAWPSGTFRTKTLAGTRPAGSVAAAWAVLHHLGDGGYRQAAHRLASMTDAYVKDIESIGGMKLWARPDMSIINFGSDDYDMNAVAGRMAGRGWLPALTRRPKGMHLMMSLLHEPVRADFMADLRTSVSEVKNGQTPQTQVQATYG